MGTLYPYTTIHKNNVMSKVKSFYKNFQKQFKEIKRLSNFTNNTILIPLGGDQAPIMKHLPEFINGLNKIDSNHE
jgi:alpha-mannosidase